MSRVSDQRGEGQRPPGQSCLCWTLPFSSSPESDTGREAQIPFLRSVDQEKRKGQRAGLGRGLGSDGEVGSEAVGCRGQQRPLGWEQTSRLGI